MADINAIQKSAQNLKRTLSVIRLLWSGQPASQEYHTCMIDIIYVFSILNVLNKLILVL